MDEVSHVKIVVSLCYFVVLDYSPCLLDGYECGLNVLIDERITKILFCRPFKFFIASRYQGYITYGIRARLKRSGLLGSKHSSIFRFN